MATAPTRFRMAGLAWLAGGAGQTGLESQVEGNPRGGRQLDGARARVWHVKVHRNMLSRPASRTSWLLICRRLTPMTLSPGSGALVEDDGDELEAGERGLRVSACLWCDMRPASQAGAG